MKTPIFNSLIYLGIFSFLTPVNAEERKPNVLIILIDDAGYHDFGFMGAKDMLTPNIDWLSSQGAVFTDAHVAATVSSPSRACLLTGRYGHRFGYECNLDNSNQGLDLQEQTIGDVFKENGYRTAAIGKWHLGSLEKFHPNQRGFDMFFGMKAGARDYFYNPQRSDRPGDERNLLLNHQQVRFDGYLTDVFSNKAAEFIKESSQPFLLYLAYNAVHTPMQATPEDLKRFERHPRQKLAAMTFALDRGIGTVINSLKESGKLDNTLIFFLSDNGGATTNTSSNEPLKGFKGNKFEGGHRIPFFIVWKNKIESNIKFEGLSSSLDIFTTALDAANIKKSKHKLDGVSLIPYLRKQKKGNPHSVLYWRKMDTRAIRMGDYKLIITHGVDSVLYNVKEDIGETHNLIHERPDLYKKMAKKMYQWEKEICIDPLWIETGWGRITNNYHKRLMHNEIKTAADLKK